METAFSKSRKPGPKKNVTSLLLGIEKNTNVPFVSKPSISSKLNLLVLCESVYIYILTKLDPKKVCNCI